MEKITISRVDLKETLQFLQEQYILLVESLDRLGRNYNDIIHIVQGLNQKKIGLIVLITTILIQELENTGL